MKLFSAILFSYFLLGYAYPQSDSCNNFLILFDNEKLCGDKLSIEWINKKSLFFKIDKSVHSFDSVKFFSNSDGFYANTKKVNHSGSSKFAKCVNNGNINLFLYSNSRYKISKAGFSKIQLYYVNKNYDDILRASKNNLSVLMKDDTEALSHLKKVAIYQNIALSLTITGLITTITGFTILSLQEKPSTNKPLNKEQLNLALFIGPGMMITSRIMFFIGPKKQKAINIYNSNH